MPFYFLRAFKKPAARADAPQIPVTHENKTYNVSYGIHHFISPGITYVNNHLSRAAKAGFQIEFYDEYLQKTQQNIDAAKKIRSKIDQTELKKDRGEKVPLNADLPELRAGTIKYVQQNILDQRNRLLEPFIYEGIKLQKIKIWKDRLLEILEGKESADKSQAFMQLYCEVWGETPSLLILMNMFAEQFNLKNSHIALNDFANNINEAFTKIQNIPANPTPPQTLYQDYLAYYLLAELIAKVTDLATKNRQDAIDLLDRTKKAIPKQLEDIFKQLKSSIEAYAELVSYNGSDEKELQTKLENFCDKATCYNRSPGVGQLPINASVLVYLTQSSKTLLDSVQRRKFSTKVSPSIIQQSQNRLDLSKSHIDDNAIAQITKHYIVELGKIVADPTKSAALIDEAQKTFQDIIDNLIQRKARRRRDAGEDLEADINIIDKLIEKANLARDAFTSNQSISDFLSDEDKIDKTGFGPDKSLILFARYLHKPADLLEKSKHLIAAKEWCEAALAEVNSKEMDQNYKNTAIKDLNSKKAEIVRAQQELAYEMFLIVKHVCEHQNVNSVNMVQLVFSKAAELNLVNKNAYKDVLPKDFPMGESILSQFIDYIDKNGSLSVRHLLHNLKYPDGHNLVTEPTIPLISHGQLKVPRVTVGEELNIHFTPEGMTPKEKPWFFQINNKARYNLMQNSNFEKINLLMAEINMAMRVANQQHGPLGEATQYKVLQWIETAKQMLHAERQRLSSSWTGGGDFDANYHKVISYAENQLYSSAYQLARAISGRLDATFFQEKDFLMSKESLDAFKGFVTTYGKTLLKVNEAGRPIESASEADYSKTFSEKTDFLNLFLSKLKNNLYLTSERQVLTIKKHGDSGIYEIQHDANLCENYHIAKLSGKKQVAEQTKFEINAVRLITAIVTGVPELADFNNDRDDLEKVRTLPDDIIKIISKLPGKNKDSAKELLTEITKRYISTRSLTDLTNSQVLVMQHFDSGMWDKHHSSMAISHRHMLEALEFLDGSHIHEAIGKCNSPEMQACFLTFHRTDNDQIINDQQQRIVVLEREIAPQIIQNATRLISYQDELRLSFEQGLKGKVDEKPLPGLTDIIAKIMSLRDIRLSHLERIILNVNPPSNTALSTYRVKLLDLYFAKDDLIRAKKSDMPADRQKLIDTLPCHFSQEQIKAIRIKIEDPQIVADPSLLILVRDIIKCEKDETLRDELLRRLQFSAIRHYLAIDPIQKNTNQQLLLTKKKQLDEALKDINVERFYTAEETNEFVELLRLKAEKVEARELVDIKEDNKKTKTEFDTLKQHELNTNIGQTLGLDEVSRVNYPATLDTIYEYLPPLAKKAAVHTLSIKLIETGTQLDDAKLSLVDGTYVDGNLEFIRKILKENEKDSYFDEKQYETLLNALKVYLTKAEYKIWPLIQLFKEYGGQNLAATYGLNLIQRIIFEQVGLRDQAKEDDKSPNNVETQVVKSKPAELLREPSLDNQVLNTIANNYFGTEESAQLQNLAKTYAYTRDSYVRNLLIDILKEGDSNRITSELQRNQEDLIRVSKSIKDAIEWIHRNEVTSETQVKLSTFIGSGISVLGSDKVEYKDRDIMFQGFLNEIAAKFAATQSDAGYTSDERKDEYYKISQDLATLTLLNQTIPFINKLFTQIKRDIPQRFTPQGYHNALTAIPEHDKAARERLIAEYKKFQDTHHFELNFLRYICRHLNSINHAHIMSFMSPQDAVSYAKEIKQIYDKLNEEKQQLIVPSSDVPVKATPAERYHYAAQHKKAVQKFYADQGYLSVMSPSAIDKQLKQAVAKKIIQLYAPADKKENAKSPDEIKKSVAELLPMTDINVLSREFQDLVEKGWFSRPIMQDPNWLKTEKGELFESATAAAKFLKQALSQQISPSSNSMIAQAVVDWLYSMSKQIALYPDPIDRVDLTKEKQKQLADFETFIKNFLPNIDVKSLSRRELIIRLLASGPNAGANEFASLKVLISKINEFENLKISNDETTLKQLQEALHETRDMITNQVTYARSTALQLYTMMSDEELRFQGKEQFLHDFSDFMKKLLDYNEFERTRYFIIEFNINDKSRNVIFKNFQVKLDSFIKNNETNFQPYRLFLAATFSSNSDLQELANSDPKINEMLKRHREVQFDLSLHALMSFEQRLRDHIKTKDQNAIETDLQLLLMTYSYLVRCDEQIEKAATKFVHNVLTQLLTKGMGKQAIDVINQFITSEIASKRHDMAVDAIYRLSQRFNNDIKQIEQRIKDEEQNIAEIKQQIVLEQNKYQTIVTYDSSDAKYHNIISEFLIKNWEYEDQLILEVAEKTYQDAHKRSEYLKEISDHKVSSEVKDAGFNKDGDFYSHFDKNVLTDNHHEKRKQLVNTKLLRIALLFSAIDQMLIDAQQAAELELSSKDISIKFNALAKLNAIDDLIEDMPHQPKYLLELKQKCEALISRYQVSKVDKDNLNELITNHRTNLQHNINLIKGDDRLDLKKLYDTWEVVSTVAGHLNDKLINLRQVKQRIQQLNDELVNPEKRLAAHKKLLQKPVEYQSGVKSFLFLVKNVASTLANKVIVMVNRFWSGSVHRHNEKRIDATANATSSIKAHLELILASHGEANYSVIFQTYENPLLDNAIKIEIKEIYLKAIKASSTYLKTLQEQLVKHITEKNWVAAIPLVFKLININPKEGLYFESIKHKIDETFSIRKEKPVRESDQDYYQRVIEGIKLLSVLYRSPEYLKNDGQINALREFAKTKFLRMIDRCDTYQQIEGHRAVDEVSLHILAASIQSLSLILPINQDAHANEIYRRLDDKVDKCLLTLLQNKENVQPAVQFFYGVCPSAKGIENKMLWSIPLNEAQVSLARYRNFDFNGKMQFHLAHNAQAQIPGLKQAMIDYFGEDKATQVLANQQLDKNDKAQNLLLENMVEKLDSIYIDQLYSMNAFDMDDLNREYNVYEALKHAMDTFLSNDQLKKFLSNLDSRLIKDHKTAEQIYARFAPAVIASFSRIQSNTQEYKILKVYFSLDKLSVIKNKLDRKQALVGEEKANFENYCNHVIQFGDAIQQKYAEGLIIKQQELEIKAEDPEISLLSRFVSTVSFGVLGGKKLTPPATPTQAPSSPLATPTAPASPLATPRVATPARPHAAANTASPSTGDPSRALKWAAAPSPTGTAQLMHLPGTSGSQVPHQATQESNPIFITLPENTKDILPAIPNGLCGYNSIILQIGLAAVQYQQKPNSDLYEMLENVYNELKKINKNRTILGEQNSGQFCTKLAVFMSTEDGRARLQTLIAPYLFTLAHAEIEQDKQRFLEFAKQEIEAAFEVFSYSALNIGYDEAIKQLKNELSQGELNEILDDRFYRNFTAQLQAAYDVSRKASAGKLPTSGQFETAVSNAKLEIGKYFNTVAEQYWTMRNNNKWLGQYEIDKLGKKLDFKAKIYRKKDDKWEVVAVVGKEKAKIDLDMARTGVHYDALLTERHKPLLVPPSQRHRP